MSRLNTLAHSRIRLGHAGKGSISGWESLCHLHLQTPKSDWFCVGRRCSNCPMDTHYACAGELNRSIKELSDE